MLLATYCLGVIDTLHFADDMMAKRTLKHQKETDKEVKNEAKKENEIQKFIKNENLVDKTT